MPALKKYICRSVPYSAMQEYKMLQSARIYCGVRTSIVGY
jgi:hypothetical protein